MLQDFSPTTLQLLDTLLYAVHILLIGFNLFGWIWLKTRPLHLLSVALTAVSWFVFGIWYGFGYCLVTDWQWEVKREMGQIGLPSSFIDHFVNQVVGFSIDPELIDILTGALFALVAIVSIILNVRDRRRKR